MYRSIFINIEEHLESFTINVIALSFLNGKYFLKNKIKLKKKKPKQFLSF